MSSTEPLDQAVAAATASTQESRFEPDNLALPRPFVGAVIIYLTHPKRFVSLWEMLKQYMSPVAAIVAHELTLFTFLEEKMSDWDGTKQVDADMFGRIKERAEAAAKIVSDLNLNMSGKKTRMLPHCIVENITQIEELRNRMREVRETIIQELSSVNFLRVTDDMQAYLDKPTPFGASVSSAFPQIAEDIEEAHQCLAFGQYTATAFHISRAMEVVVRSVAKKMRVTASRDEWQSYINAMDDAIKKMPFKAVKDKAKRSMYSEASNYLFNFKEAFRNKTMHPKKTYNRKEALRVVESACDFLKYTAEYLFRRRDKS